MPNPVITVVGVSLLLILLASFVYWVIVIVRIARGRRIQPRLRHGLAAAAGYDAWPRLSIIIPAHDEDRVIEKCVRSLRVQDYPDLEIVFVLDRCTDRTAAILAPHAAEDSRIVVVTNDTCPDDWAGKCNAAWQGVRRASGTWVLFTDADTEFAPKLCRAAVALARKHDAGLLSLLTTLTCRHYHEYVAQPVAAFILMHVYPAVRMRRDRPPRAFANGQFMLFRRDWYDRIDGHAGVKDELLEDLAFARATVAAGGHLVVAADDGMCHCAMYDSLAAFEQGWRRIFIEAVKRKPHDLRRYARRVRALSLQPLATLAAIGLGLGLLVAGNTLAATVILAAATLTTAAQVIGLLLVYPPAGAPVWGMLLFPFGARIVARVLRDAADDLEQRRSIQWGGREYVFEPRVTGAQRDTFTLQKPAEPTGSEPVMADR